MNETEAFFRSNMSLIFADLKKNIIFWSSFILEKLLIAVGFLASSKFEECFFFSKLIDQYLFLRWFLILIILNNFLKMISKEKNGYK